MRSMYMWYTWLMWHIQKLRTNHNAVWVHMWRCASPRHTHTHTHTHTHKSARTKVPSEKRSISVFLLCLIPEPGFLLLIKSVTSGSHMAVYQKTPGERIDQVGCCEYCKDRTSTVRIKCESSFSNFTIIDFHNTVRAAMQFFLQFWQR